MSENGPESTALTASTPARPPARVTSSVPIWDSDSFEHAKRVAFVLAKSQLVPQHLRGDEHVPDLILLCLMAQARNEHPLALAQHVYFVAGRAGYAAAYLIAQANRSGTFRGPIRWRETGSGDSLRVEAWALLRDSGEEVSVATSMAMAKSEGWTQSAKYRSMPEQMLRYRSATMLVRLYCPEVIMATGPAVEEIDVPEPEPESPKAGRSAAATVAAHLGLGPHTIDVPRAEPQPAPAAVRKATAETAAQVRQEAAPAPERAPDSPEVAALREQLRRALAETPDKMKQIGIYNGHGIARGGEGWLRTHVAKLMALDQPRAPEPPREREPGDDDDRGDDGAPEQEGMF